MSYTLRADSASNLSLDRRRVKSRGKREGITALTAFKDSQDRESASRKIIENAKIF